MAPQARSGAGREGLKAVCLGGAPPESMKRSLPAPGAGREPHDRLAQGICGAPLVPLSQTVNINTCEEHGRAMAIWGAGIMVGPIIGPTLDGWLTETLNWRWVFYVNLPVGLLALAGMIAFLPRAPRRPRGFDFFGFAIRGV